MNFNPKEEMMNQFDTVKVIPERLENIIKKRGKKFGSCVFGGLQESSDIDILFLVDKNDEELELLNNFYFLDRMDTKLMRYVAGQYRGEGGEFVSVYVKCRFTKRPVNLLLFDDPEIYQVWADATAIMKLALQNSRIKEVVKNKQRRVSFFEEIKHIIRR